MLPVLAASDASPARTLEALIKEHAPAEASDFLQAPGDLYFEMHRVDTTSRITYLGEHRPIPEERRRFLEAYFERALKQPAWSAQYKEEVLCSEGKTHYWLPLQDSLLGYLVEEIKAPAELAMGIGFLGAYRARSGDLIDVLIVTEFSEPK